MNQEQAQAAEAKADVKNSAVGNEASDADDIQAALALVEGEGATEETPKDPEPTEAKPDEEGEPDKSEKKDDAEDEEPKGPAAKGWAAVRKREQRVAKEAKLNKEQQQFLQNQYQQLQERAKAVEEREAELEKDPVGVLTKKGLNFDDLARRYLQDGKPSEQEVARRGSDEVKTVKTELEQLRNELREERTKQREETLVNEYRGNIKATLAADEFELLRTYPDAEAEVFAFADRWARQTGQVLQPSEAASRLQAEWQKQLKQLAAHQAVKDLLLGATGAANKQAVGGQSQVPQRPGASPKTLTNNLAATPAAGDPDWDSLSEDELIHAALRSVPG